jgi:hypothetical protein
VLISHFLNCNKVKQQKWTAAEIADAVKDSTKVELNKNKLTVRRSGNLSLPEIVEKKRDVKAEDKRQAQQAKVQED